MKRSRIRTAVVTIAVAVSLFFPPRAEAFKGEDELVKNLKTYERELYNHLQYLMNRFQKKQFLTLSSGIERKKWVDDFWIYKDPTPTTALNERKIEHEKRVELAKKLFGMDKPPGWDKRGETLIRFGMPSVRTKVPGEIGFYGMVPPGEVWYYTSLDMLIPFHNFNLNGVFIYAIERQGQSSRQTLDQLQAIYQFYSQGTMEQIMLTPTSEVMALSALNPDKIDYIADPDLREKLSKDLIAAIEKEKVQKSRNNFYKYLEENPTIYSFEVNRKPLPVYFDITNYRQAGDLVESVVSFEVPSEEIRFLKKSGQMRGEVNLSLLVRDMELNRVVGGTDEIKVSFEGGESFLGPSYLPGQISVTLKPGYYRLGIEAFDLNSERRGVFNTNLLVPTMNERPAISDIRFASSIREVSDGTKFVREGLQIVPHPLHAYRKPYPLTFYFEIYNLEVNRDNIAFYSIEYKITPLGKKRKGPVLKEVNTAVSSNFQAEGYGSRQIQRLEIATDNLWQGTFMLTISVMDRATRSSAQKTARFSILD